MKTLLKAAAISSFAVLTLIARDDGIKQVEVKVSGNCSQCKTRIENAVKVKGVKYAKWDKKSKQLTLAYIPSVISLDSLEHRIALAGHDNERFTAPDSVYNELPGCCQYRGTTDRQ